MYNSQETIGKCLDSIYNSDYPRNKYEVIVVDDGSTDNSANLAGTYPCKLIKLNKNGGPAAARNLGTKKSKGNILVFVDSDVAIGKKFLRSTIDCFNEGVASLTAMNLKKTSSNFTTNFSNLLDHFTFLKSPQYVILPCTSYFAIKTEVFREIGMFNEKYKKPYVEDLELGLRLVKKGYKIYLNKQLKFEHMKKHIFLGFLKNRFLRSFYRIKCLLKEKNIKTTSSHYPSNILLLFLLLFFTGLGSLLNKAFFLLCFVLIILFFLNNFEFLKFLKEEKGIIFSIASFFMIMVHISIWIAGITIGSISFFLGGKYQYI